MVITEATEEYCAKVSVPVRVAVAAEKTDAADDSLYPVSVFELANSEAFSNQEWITD